MESFMNIATSFLNTLKAFAKYLIIPSSLLLFLPEWVLAKYNANELIDPWRSYIFLAFVVSASIIFIDFIFYIITKMRAKIYAKRIMRLLNKSDKEVLAAIYYNGGNLPLEYNDAISSKLRGLGVISCANASKAFYIFDHYLQPWTEKYLQKNDGYLPKMNKKIEEIQEQHDFTLNLFT